MLKNKKILPILVLVIIIVGVIMLAIKGMNYGLIYGNNTTIKMNLGKQVEVEDIAKEIKNSQFNGDSNWMQYLGKKQSKMLIDNFDILVKAMYVSDKDINTKEIREEWQHKRISARDTIKDFIDNYCSKEDVETFMQSLANADKKTIEMIQQLNVSKQNTNDVSGQIRR